MPAASEVGREDTTSGTCYSALSWLDMANCELYTASQEYIVLSRERAKYCTSLINAAWYILIKFFSVRKVGS
jgi:hypothetical protein